MDIINRTEIEILVNAFYDKVKKDDTIGYIFNEIIGGDWSHHLPIMYNFWEMILLNHQTYAGNPVKKHIEIDRKIALQEIHYNRWLALWNDTVNTLYEGPKADEAKNRAFLMMNLIKMKVQWARNSNAIQ